MKEGQTNTAITAAAFGFHRTGLAPIDNVPLGVSLSAVLHLARILPGSQVRSDGCHVHPSEHWPGGM